MRRALHFPRSVRFLAVNVNRFIFVSHAANLQPASVLGAVSGLLTASQADKCQFSNSIHWEVYGNGHCNGDNHSFRLLIFCVDASGFFRHQLLMIFCQYLHAIDIFRETRKHSAAERRCVLFFACLSTHLADLGSWDGRTGR